MVKEQKRNIVNTLKHVGLLFLALPISFSAHAFLDINNSSSEMSLLERGEYVAQAADCIACHRSGKEGDAPFVGGHVIDAPIGNIVGSNITPSKQYGIGNYSEADFKKALTEGVTPSGKHLYPAMPYTSYRNLSDEDIHALYIYFMQGVEAVDREAAQTKLSFPYSMRYVVKTAGMVFLQEREGAYTNLASTELERGRYLVDVLGHCSMCHTPRNLMMAEENKSNYLAGSPLGPWYAPNITSDAISGIGGWSQDELVQYLRTGNVAGKAQAAGGMAEAIEHSFRFLSNDDLNAIAEYLLQTPAIRTGGLDKPTFAYTGSGVTAESLQTPNGRLYTTACATCHGVEGKGSFDGYFPSLTNNTVVGTDIPNNLIMVILEGVERQDFNNQISMPAFGKDLSDQEVAGLVNYISESFGNGKMKVTAADVAQQRAGGELPIIVKLTPYLIGGGVVFGLLVLFLIFRRFKKKK